MLLLTMLFLMLPPPQQLLLFPLLPMGSAVLDRPTALRRPPGALRWRPGLRPRGLGPRPWPAPSEPPLLPLLGAPGELLGCRV